MSAAAALRAAHDAGIGLHVDGVDLVLEASAPPPAAILDLLSRHKADLIVLLRSSADGWSVEDWRAFYDERAAIAEFDGGLSRRDAEALAHDCCLTEWLNHHPVRSSPDRCLWCGQAEGSHVPLVPFGNEAVGHTWLHPRCWEDWHARRKIEATDALAVMGIIDRSNTT